MLEVLGKDAARKVLSPDGRSLSGTQTCEQNGKRWIAFTVQGAKARS